MKPFFVIAALLALGCARPEKPRASSGAAGNTNHGQELAAQYGCPSCHQIPGFEGASGTLGPALDHFGSRPMLAGKFQNNPAVLEQWLQNPQSLDPQTSMPNLGIAPADARDISAFLYTLK